MNVRKKNHKINDVHTCDLLSHLSVGIPYC